MRNTAGRNRRSDDGTLPLRLTGTRDIAAPGDTVIAFEGQFVATRAVPEPTLGAVALLGRRGRR